MDNVAKYVRVTVWARRRYIRVGSQCTNDEGKALYLATESMAWQRYMARSSK